MTSKLYIVLFPTQSLVFGPSRNLVVVLAMHYFRLQV